MSISWMDVVPPEIGRIKVNHVIGNATAPGFVTVKELEVSNECKVMEEALMERYDEVFL